MGINSIEAFSLNICPLPLSELIEYLDISLINHQKPVVISGVNAYAIVQSAKDKIYRDYLLDSTIVNIDGISVVMALRFLGHKVKERVSCPDLFHELVSLAQKRNYSIYLVGSKPGIVSSAVRNLQERYPELKIAGFDSGYYDAEGENKIIADIVLKKPEMLFLGMPSPRKEAFAFKCAEQYSIPLILGIGGLIDIEAGVIKRAPLWCQKIGMEWFFRFAQEPKRMWRRYLIGNLEFIWLVLRERFKK